MRKNIVVEFTNERIIPSGGLAVVGAILGKSYFVKRCNRMKVDCNHPQHLRRDPASAFWELAVIPWLMEDIDGKEAELGNGAVDGAVGNIPFFLDPLDVITKFLPGNIFRILFQDLLEILKIRADVGTVTFEGMVGKTTE